VLTKRVGLLGGAHAFARVPATNEFILASYEQGGYDIARTASLPSRSIKISGAATPVPPLDTSGDANPAALSAPHEFSPWETLYPRAWVPSILFVPNGVQFGAWIPGFDISEKNYYNLFGGYDTRGLPFADFNYGYRFGGKYGIDTDIFYSPTYIISQQAFLKEWGASAGFTFSPWNKIPTLTVGPIFRRLEASGYGPADQQVGLQASLVGRIGGIDQRPLDISPRWGTTLSLTHSQYFTGLGSFHNFFSTVAQIEQYLPAPWIDSHRFYLSARAGYTDGNYLFNSFFQGGGELLFYQQRGFFLDRAYTPGQYLGRRMFTLTSEYRFPIYRVEHGLGVLPIYLKNIHGALVSDVLTKGFGPGPAGDPYGYLGAYDRLFQIFHISAGLEISTDWVFSYYLPTRVRLGGYHAFDPYGENLYVTCGVEAAL
jgi:hypothetical protein